MASDTVTNQKVFVSLQGVLRLQDEVRRLEVSIDVAKGDADSAALLRARHHGLAFAIQTLGLPIETRIFLR